MLSSIWLYLTKFVELFNYNYETRNQDLTDEEMVEIEFALISDDEKSKLNYEFVTNQTMNQMLRLP